MLTIGLTGGIGSGKSTVANLFSQHGITVIDADQFSRQLTEPNSPVFEKILHHFGQNILDEHGEIERSRLRKIIFKNQNERKWLENLLHPLIRAAMLDTRNQSTAPYCVMVIPLLSESKGIDFIDRICVIDSPEKLQIQRASTRDDCNPNIIKQIILSQHDNKKRLKIADDVIENKAGIAELKTQVDRLHQHYFSIASKKETT